MGKCRRCSKEVGPGEWIENHECPLAPAAAPADLELPEAKPLPVNYRYEYMGERRTLTYHSEDYDSLLSLARKLKERLDGANQRIKELEPAAKWDLLLRAEQAERKLAEAESRAGKDREDAERYRRLRENWINCDELKISGRLAVMDAAIDAARRGEEGSK